MKRERACLVAVLEKPLSRDDETVEYPSSRSKATARAPSRQSGALTSKRFDGTFRIMSSEPKRATIYVDPDLHRALKIKAAETERSISELVNDAIKASLAEDAEDLRAFAERA